MEKSFCIMNKPDTKSLWKGIGGHFDSLVQIINEFLDNSISNFNANNTQTRNIIISIKELRPNGNVRITIEDSGTGIKDIDNSLTIGSTLCSETPLNEHGFGLKHALAAADPSNKSWHIYTRTEEDFKNKQFKKISAPYEIGSFNGTISTDENWPG